jgi:glycosyltransferase involved in cell wall biosynthesis
VRILHVVTLVSPDGAFGGPVRVAENLARELIARGHDVTVAAAARGYAEGETPTELGGAPLLTFPARRVAPGGFSGLTAPGLQSWIRRHAAGLDVAHVHLARDLVTLPAASSLLRRNVPYVLQTHGMVVESSHPFARPLDTAMTRRVLSGAGAVLHLTAEERAGLLAVGAPERLLVQLGNGVPDVAQPAPLPDRPEVLFLARLQERKRPQAFTRMARTLLAEGVDASFVLVGPDEGEGDAVRADVAAVGDGSRLRYEGPLPPTRTLERLSAASLVVLPSVHEPYPMSVLEAMSAGRGVVITDTCGLAPAVAETRAGLVVDDSQEALDAAVRGLLSTPGELAAVGARAHRASQEVFGMRAVVDRLEDAYATAIAAARRG